MPTAPSYNAHTEGQGVFVDVFTFAHTTANSNRKLYVNVCWSLIPGLTFTSVKYAGVAMTNVGGTVTAANGLKSQVFELVNPALGTNNVVVTTVGGSGDILACYADSFYDCKQSAATVFGTDNASVNPHPQSLTIVADQSVCYLGGNGSLTASTNSTKRSTSPQSQGGAVYTSPAASPGTFTMTVSGTTNNAFVMIAVEPLDPPAVLIVSPNTGTTLGGTSVAITGSGFTGGDSFEFEGVAATSVVIVDPNHATCVTPSVLGATRSVNVTLNGAGTLVNGYTYVKPATVLTPHISIRGIAAFDIYVYSPGDVFTSSTTASFSGTGVTVNSVTFIDVTHLKIRITVASSAAIGLRDLTLTTP